MKFQVIYRFSNKREKTELFDITKMDCLVNFGKVFGFNNFIFIADNSKVSIDYLNKIGITSIFSTGLGNAGSLRFAFDIAYQYFSDDTIIYFVEDDFLHHPKASKDLIIEGLEKVDYVSLYDHSDKYKLGMGNPLVDDYGEETKVFLTKSSHWKFTNSTVQTFACKVQTLKEDKDILYKYNFNESNRPDSYSTFRDLRIKGRKLATTIPGRSTHCHSPWESPLIDWREVWMQTKDI